mmetsp:Transcript_27915/g.74654  ORF Transcript_27915/g.74654 Transcript_27915/m.74654 type:complete len:213 (+) Transcript_27915:169-807(+)
MLDSSALCASVISILVLRTDPERVFFPVLLVEVRPQHAHQAAHQLEQLLVLVEHHVYVHAFRLAPELLHPCRELHNVNAPVSIFVQHLEKHFRISDINVQRGNVIADLLLLQALNELVERDELIPVPIHQRQQVNDMEFLARLLVLLFLHHHRAVALGKLDGAIDKHPIYDVSHREHHEKHKANDNGFEQPSWATHRLRRHPPADSPRHAHE